MKIVHVASELTPIAKAGGLADVVYGLSRALLNKQQKIEVILPKYDILALEQIENLKVAGPSIWKGYVDKIPVTLIELPKFFNRSTIYGCEDDTLRFTYFCQSALAYLLKSEEPPDLIHLHDWHTALIAPLLKDKGLQIPTLFTIHNLAYLGECNRETFEKIGWKSEAIKELKLSNTYSLLKGGIVFSDHITTVSPTYAKEILKTGPLRSTLKKYHKKLTGILNGIDFDYWNPETDPSLPFHYSLKHLERKVDVKNYLRNRLKLEDKRSILVSSITRLVPQKGPELIRAAIVHTLERGGQFVLLGSAFDEATQAEFLDLKRKLSSSQQVHLELVYDEALAHLVFAASDLFLTPSIFEPCGLTPLIAMRYGTVPLVHQTGGLIDTIFDGKNGFSFSPPTPKAINHTLDRAFKCWNEKPKFWGELMKKGMQEDYSWNRSAEIYLRIYDSLPFSVSKRMT